MGEKAAGDGEDEDEHIFLQPVLQRLRGSFTESSQQP